MHDVSLPRYGVLYAARFNLQCSNSDDDYRATFQVAVQADTLPLYFDATGLIQNPEDVYGAVLTLAFTTTGSMQPYRKRITFRYRRRLGG